MSLVLAGGLFGCAESDSAPATGGETQGASPAKIEALIPPLADGLATSWALEEFDWGDSEEVVLESVGYAAHFLCFGAHGECRVVRVRVDGEDLLARFQYLDDALWRVAILTPPLFLEDAAEHGPRVAARLSGHVSRQLGEAEAVAPFPDLQTLAAGTHALERWNTEAIQAQTVVVRRDGDKFVVAVYFADPVRAERATVTAADPTDPPPKPTRGGARRP